MKYYTVKPYISKILENKLFLCHIYYGCKLLLLKGKEFLMSFKSWSASQTAASKNKSDSKLEAVPTTSADGAENVETVAKVPPSANPQPDDKTAKGLPMKES